MSEESQMEKAAKEVCIFCPACGNPFRILDGQKWWNIWYSRAPQPRPDAVIDKALIDCPKCGGHFRIQSYGFALNDEAIMENLRNQDVKVGTLATGN